MRKINWNKDFQLDENVRIECGWQNTSYGFRHLAVLRVNGLRTIETKACYYNRTWESYTYQSVVHKAIEKYCQGEQAEKLIKAADAIGKGEAENFLKGFKMLAAMGEILGDTPEEKIALKKKALSAIPGIDFPEDFDALPEKEKVRRINGALGVL